MVIIFILFSIFSITTISSEDGPEEPGLTYQSLFVTGINAYNQERWTECLTLVDKALKDYKTYHKKLNECRIRCRDAALVEINETNFLESIYLDSSQRQSVCIKNCTEKAFPGRQSYLDTHAKLREIELRFQDLDPYDYIQMCAFKSRQYDIAFSAAFTFAMARPNHPYAQNNLEFYKKVAGGKLEMFKNLEHKPHQELWNQGLQLYEKEEWGNSTIKFEESLVAYFKADEECNAECDSYLDELSFSELHKKVSEATFKEEARYYLATHWLKLLSCKELCGRKLATVNGTLVDKFFLEHFHYLQYAYYKAGNSAKAVKSVASFLLFSPTDANQLYNKIFYVQQGLVSETDFIPREDAKRFYEKRAFDEKLANLAEEEVLKNRRKRSYKPHTHKSLEIYAPKSDDFPDSYANFTKSLAVTMVSSSTELGGSQRLVVDGVASPEDCRKLIQLSNLSQRNKVTRVTVSKAAEMVRDRKASVDQVSIFMHMSEKVRQILEKYHNLKVPLLFQRTQLTYRGLEKDPGSSEGLTLDDLDGCSTEGDILCTGSKRRDFVAYVHLGGNNEDGGEFSFLNDGDPAKPRVPVEPKQGRMIGLNIEDKHSLRRLKSGRMYVLIIWFTLSPAHQELDHAEARTVLRIVQTGTVKTSRVSLDSLDYMKSKHFTLSLDEEDLNGPERFAADGLATEDECQALIRLTNAGGSLGDGYDGRDPISPHTKYEAFEGLNVLDAAELALEHKVSSEDVKSYLRLSNEMRELTRRVLVGDRPLYFSFTHLVCRTALNDANLDRTDLSHPIHSDNCIIQQDNSCKKVRPAYIERDYSAILYLNDDFFGGDFFFAHQNMSVQSSVKPKCGRIVSFNAGHYHGVKPVLSGQRCAVAIWFTLDRNFDEASHPIAEKILEKLTTTAYGPSEHIRVEL